MGEHDLRVSFLEEKRYVCKHATHVLRRFSFKTTREREEREKRGEINTLQTKPSRRTGARLFGESGRVEQDAVLGNLELDAFLGVVRCDSDAYEVLGLFGGALCRGPRAGSQ